MSDARDVSAFWPADNSAVTAHINLLQSIIARLANNSASCKTWCLLLVSAFISFAGATRTPSMITFALVPVLIFGFMDAMYLAQERAYRDLYGRIVTSIRSGAYGRNDVFEAGAPVDSSGLSSALRSWSIFPVYGGLILGYLVAYQAGWLPVLTAAPTR
jgi:hypothetical protein